MGEEGAGPVADVGRTRRGVESESQLSVCEFAGPEAGKEHTIPSLRVEVRRTRRPRRGEPTSAFGPAGHHYQA